MADGIGGAGFKSDGMVGLWIGGWLGDAIDEADVIGEGIGMEASVDSVYNKAGDGDRHDGLRDGRRV